MFESANALGVLIDAATKGYLYKTGNAIPPLTLREHAVVTIMCLIGPKPN